MKLKKKLTKPRMHMLSAATSKRMLVDHAYDVKYSPRYLKTRLNLTENCLAGQFKKRKTLQQRVRRLKRKVTSLSKLIDELQQKNLISVYGACMLSGCSAGAPLELFKRINRDKKLGHLSRDSYSPEMQKFAFTLHFYSPKAYKYVRSTFRLSLPHTSVIKTWYGRMNGEPGLTIESLDVLKLHVQQAKLENTTVYCNLVLDEMAIRKHVEWDGKQFRGYVDMGTEVEDDSLPVATEALVLMLVSINSS